MTSFAEFFSQNPSSIFQNICTQSSTHFDKILIIISHPNQNSKSLKLQLINSPTYKPPHPVIGSYSYKPPPRKQAPLQLALKIIQCIMMMCHDIAKLNLKSSKINVKSNLIGSALQCTLF